jgi:hypothetical protein
VIHHLLDRMMEVTLNLAQLLGASQHVMPHPHQLASPVDSAFGFPADSWSWPSDARELLDGEEVDR